MSAAVLERALAAAAPCDGTFALVVPPATSSIREAGGARWFDLQLFAADDEGRTEDATAKRISKARGEGQVAKSAEIPQAVALLLGVLTVTIFLPKLIGHEVAEMKYWFQNLGSMELTHESLRVHFLRIGAHVAAVLWPIALVEILVAVVGNIAQVGWLFTWQPLQPQWTKILPNPQKLVDRLLFGKTVAFNFFKSILKLLFVGWIAGVVLWDNLGVLRASWGMQPVPFVQLVAAISWEITWKVCLFLLAIAAADYLFNLHMWKESLKMKREEVKDEQKQSEGDPMVKQAQRRRMIQAMRRRMMKEVPTADVVITNPTHYAIAIKYDQSTMTAPSCVAKGEGHLALKIRQIAEEHGVPTYENKPLAQALYRAVEVGDEIPPEFYQAVAEVLAFVYRQKRAVA